MLKFSRKILKIKQNGQKRKRPGCLASEPFVSKINDGIASLAESACNYPLSFAILFCLHLAAAMAGQPPAEPVVVEEAMAVQ